MGDGLEDVNDRIQAGFRTNFSELKNKDRHSALSVSQHRAEGTAAASPRPQHSSAEGSGARGVQTAKASRKQSSLSGKESAQGCIPKRLLEKSC